MDAPSALLAMLWRICGGGYTSFVSFSKVFQGKVKLQGAPRHQSPGENPRLDTSKMYPLEAAHEAPRCPVAGWLRWLQVDMAGPCSQRASMLHHRAGQQ